MASPVSELPVYELQLDLHMHFCPPMDDRGKGITLTRSLHLPFPPVEGLSITGKLIDPFPMSEGFKLKSVVWDCDRSRFTADIETSSHGFPLAIIPYELNVWIELGWRLGSYEDDFPDSYGNDDDEESDSTSDEAEPAPDEWEEMDLWPKLPPRRRSKEFNKLFRAMIRVMCETNNADSRAYAMWKTKRLFTEEELKTDDSPAAKKFKDAATEFLRMPFDEQYDWKQRIRRTYPRLENVL